MFGEASRDVHELVSSLVDRIAEDSNRRTSNDLPPPRVSLQ